MKDNKLYLEKKITLTNEFFNEQEEITMYGLTQIFELMADMHANKLKIGKTQVKALGLAWVIARQEIKKLASPKLFEIVKVITYPYPTNGVEFYRHYEIVSLDDAITYVKADALWVLLDIEKATVARNKIEYPEGSKFVKKNTPDFDKIDVSEVKPFTTYKVLKSDLDKNKHMNNGKYFPLFNEVLGLTDSNYKSVLIFYHNQIKLNEKMDIYVKEDKKKYYLSGKKDDTLIFSSYLERK